MTHGKQLRSTRGLEALERVRGICSVFPDVDEAVDSFGHTSFRIRNKPFVMMGEGADEASLTIKADRTSQDLLVRSGRYRPTPYIGQHGWVTCPADQTVEWAEVEELIGDAFRMVAPKSVLRGLDG